MREDFVTALRDLERRLSNVETGVTLTRPHTKWRGSSTGGGGGGGGDGGTYHSVSYSKFYPGSGPDNEWSMTHEGSVVFGTYLSHLSQFSDYSSVRATTGNDPKVQVGYTYPQDTVPGPIRASVTLGYYPYSVQDSNGVPDIAMPSGSGSEWHEFTTDSFHDFTLTETMFASPEGLAALVYIEAADPSYLISYEMKGYLVIPSWIEP